MMLPKEIQLQKSTTAPIVQVDDDEIAISIVQRYHKKSTIKNPFTYFLDGDDFLDNLQKEKMNNHELPLLVLLDINMPGKSGFDVLKELRADQYFKEIPLCVMLSSSTYEKDMNQSKALGADSYLIKPDNPKAYIDLFADVAVRVGG